MVPILVCSVVAVGIIIDRAWCFYRSREDADAIFEAANELLREGDQVKALKLCQRSQGPVAGLLHAGLNHKHLTKWKLEETLSVLGQEEINRLGRNLRGLEVIANIAPLLGLLGTVTGMVQAFHRVAQLGGGVDPGVLAGGIWEALITTAAGLTVAIPVFVVLHYFKSRIEKVAFQMEKYGRFLIHLFYEEDEGEKERAEVAEKKAPVVPQLTQLT